MKCFTSIWLIQFAILFSYGVSGAILLDGRINERDWNEAKVYQSFQVIEPRTFKLGFMYTLVDHPAVDSVAKVSTIDNQ